MDVAGDDFSAWSPAHAVVTVVALYDGPQILPLPDMYGKNLTFKNLRVEAAAVRSIELIRKGKLIPCR